MPDRPEHNGYSLTARLKRLRVLARAVILWETAALAFWRIDFWVLFFAGLWLMRIPAMMGTAGSALALIAFFGGLVFLLRDLRGMEWPDESRADRRLEESNKLVHRPLAMLADRPANPQYEETRQLWRAGRDAALALAEKLKPVTLPRPLLAKADPAALRVIAVLMFAAGLSAAGPQWKDRIAYGLLPFSVHWQDRTGETLTLWITPPAYTGLAQTTVQGTGDKTPVPLPEGSIVKARIAGGIGRPVLKMGTETLPLKRLDTKTWGIETKAATAVDKIALRQMGLTRAAIPVRYIPDTPPEIALDGDPAVLPKGPLQARLKVKDDYGVSDVIMRMTLDPSVNVADIPAGQAVEDSRAVMSAPKIETDIAPVYDLTGHPWAGLAAVLTFEVRDRAGHIAAAAPVHITLPDRAFFNPVARRIADLRKRLLWTPDMSAGNVVGDLEDLLTRPGEYNGDTVVLLALSSAASRLSYADDLRGASTPVSALLWDTALRVEDGNLSLAARELREARQEMEKLLADPSATQEQIAAAMQKLREAMGSYFQELYRELAKQMADSGQTLPELPPEAFSQNLSADDISSFLDQLQSDALTGDRDAARQMLSQLQQMTDMLDPSTSMKLPPQIQQMMDGMNKLKDVVDRQKKLAEETEKLDPAAKTQEQKEAQESIRRDLGEVMAGAGAQMDNIPEGLQKGEQAMRNAAAALEKDDGTGSLPHQKDAIEQLQSAQQDMNKQLSAMMQQMTMMSFGVGQTDPLGRPMSEGQGPSLLPGAHIKIPDESQRKRVQEILNLLRQRSGDRSRPDYELDYYRRLMRQF